MAESTFLKTDNLLVTNIRIETKKKMVLVNSISTVEIGKEKIDKPWMPAWVGCTEYDRAAGH